MTNNLLVIKLGGDAVANPVHIAAAAARVASEAAHRPVVVVTSARRGMTDHLIELCRGVDLATGAPADTPLIAADRAIATGELVTASLLTLALQRLSVAAVTRDARQAGLRGNGPPGDARLRMIRRTALRNALHRGQVPVVTGFQVIDRGEIRTLGRGGSDVTAVAIAAALGAQACRFYKLHGLRGGDPLRDPGAAPVGTIDYPELRRLLVDGAQVLHPDAAGAAERFGLRLEFEEFPGDGPRSVVNPAHT